MLHRAVCPKALSFRHQIAGRMRRTRNLAVVCWSSCHSHVPSFLFSPFLRKVLLIAGPEKLGAVSLDI